MPELSQLIAGEDRSLSACTKMAATWGWCCEAGREGKDGKPSGPFFFSTRSAEGWRRRQKRRVNDREKEEGHGTALCCRWAGPGAPWLLLLAGSGAPGAAFSGLQPGSPGKKASEPPPPRSYGLGAAAGGRSPPGEKVRVAVIKNKGRLACIADACVIGGHCICTEQQLQRGPVHSKSRHGLQKRNSPSLASWSGQPALLLPDGDGDDLLPLDQLALQLGCRERLPTTLERPKDATLLLLYCIVTRMTTDQQILECTFTEQWLPSNRA